ncbi:unnamed protein product [Urochloa humidicola]
MLTVSASLPALQQQRVGLVYASLYLIAVAQGADKPCGLALAADQFDGDHPGERASRGSLFNWWFFCMAVGISVAIAGVGYIQEAVGWGVGFGLPCAIVLTAFIVFLIGTPTYRLPVSSSWYHRHRKQQPMLQSPFVRLARGLRAVLLPAARHEHDDEQQQQQQQEEEDARCLLRLLPVWVSSLAYGVVYAQIMTLFNKQGRTLDRQTIGGLQLPPAALQALGPLSILLFVPIYDRALVPALRRATGSPHQQHPHLPHRCLRPRLVRRQPQPRPPRLLLLAPRRDQRRRARALPRLRAILRLHKPQTAYYVLYDD